MRLVVGGMSEIGLIGRNQRQAETVSERDELRLHSALGVEPMALDLDIEPRVENLDEALEPALGEVAKSCSQRPVDRPRRTSGQRDKPFTFCESGERKMRLIAILGIEPQRGGEAHQVAVADLVLRQKNDRRARIVRLDATPKGGGGGGEIDHRLRADDRLPAAPVELLRKFKGA